MKWIEVFAHESLESSRICLMGVLFVRICVIASPSSLKLRRG